MAVKKAPLPPGGWSDYILSMSTVLEDKFQKRNQVFKDIHDRRYMLKSPNIPEVFRKTASEFRAPLVWDFVRRCVAIITPEIPSPKVISPRLGVETEKKSSKIEKWLSAAYYKMDDNNGIYKILVDALVEQGTAVWKALPNRKTFLAFQRGEDEDDDTYNEKVDHYRKVNFPFSWEHVPTDTWYPIDEYGRKEALEISKRETLPLAMKYNLIPDGRGGLTNGDPKTIGQRVPDYPTSSYPSTTTFREYWKAAELDDRGNLTQGTFIYMADKTIIKVGKHNYLNTPYYVAEANRTSSKDTAERALSLVYPLLNLQDNMDALRTIQMNWAYLTGFPVMRLRPQSDEQPIYDKDAEVVWEPGQAILTPGYIPEWMELPPAGRDLIAMSNFLMEIFNMVSLNPILGGVIPGANVSGVAAQTMISIAKSIFGPAIDSISKSFNEMAAFILKCIDTELGVPVPVYAISKENNEWLELSPKDIDGYYEVKHSLHPVIPAERMTKSAWLADGNARGLIPDRIVIEDGYGFEAPDEIMEELLLDKLRKSGEYQTLLAAQWLDRMKARQKVRPPQPQGALPIGPGGPGVPMVEGVQRGFGPGSQPQMPMRPEQVPQELMGVG